MEKNLLGFLKEIRRQKNFIWFKGEETSRIYQKNFKFLALEFEKSFLQKFSNSKFSSNSTVDTYLSLDFN